VTAREFASLLRARKIGRDKWVAKCPAHPDRQPSLAISVGKKVPVVMMCMSNGCDTKQILAAVGLSWTDLFDGKPTREARARLGLEDLLENLHHQLGLVIMLQVVESSKRNYWAAAERRIRGEIDQVRCKIRPEEIIQEFRERAFQARLKRLGWEGLWQGLLDGSGSPNPLKSTVENCSSGARKSAPSS
jgi:hypothetical protein